MTDIASLPTLSLLQTWVYRDDCPDDFQARLARRSAAVADEFTQLNIIQCSSLHTRSRQTSTAVHPHSEYDLNSMASDNVPGLTSESSIGSRSSSISTDMASVIDGGCMLESEDGVLTRPTRPDSGPILFCPFQILDCSQSFSDVNDFKLHVFSHFRGHTLPYFAPCFVCGKAFFRQPGHDNVLVWDNLLNHMAHEHYRDIGAPPSFRPNTAVLRYMWNRDIITDAQFTRSQFMTPNSPHSRPNDERSRQDRPPEAPMPPSSAPMPSQVRQHLNELHTGPFTAIAGGRRRERRQADLLRLRARV